MSNRPDHVRSGVPFNPERDGRHWMKTPDNEVIPFEWRAEGECERGRWPSYWVSQGEDCWTAEECEYIGPVLSYEAATALQKRVAELEEALRDLLPEAIDHRYAMQSLAVVQARAALEGKKDE